MANFSSWKSALFSNFFNAQFLNLFFVLRLKSSSQSWKWKHPVELIQLWSFPAIFLACSFTVYYTRARQSEIRWCGTSETFLWTALYLSFSHTEATTNEKANPNGENSLRLLASASDRGDSFIMKKYTITSYYYHRDQKTQKRILSRVGFVDRKAVERRVDGANNPYVIWLHCAYGKALITVYETII